MKIGLFRNTTNLEIVSDEEKLRLLGNNTGNMLFWHALKNIFDLDFIQTDNPKLEQYDAFITTDLIWLRENIDMGYLNNYFSLINDKPLIPISIGLQAGSYKVDFAIHQNTVSVLAQMAERCVLGVRGNYTAEVLNKHGIKNIQVIGCPSMYYQLDYGLNIQLKNTPNKVTTNFSTFYAQLNAKQKHFLAYCANREYSFVEQVNHPFELKHVNDEKYFNYVKNWLATSERIFYNIDEWNQYMKNYEFSMGGRFHGNVIALWNQIPALFFACDSRTTEMCDFFKLPYTTFVEFDHSKSIEYYYEKADYSVFNMNYKNCLNGFVDFMNTNNINVKELKKIKSHQDNDKIEKIIVDKQSVSVEIALEDADIISDFQKAHCDNPDVKLILYGITSLNRWSYKPQLVRMGIPIYAYVDEKRNGKLDGLNILKLHQLKDLCSPIYILASTEKNLIGKDIETLSKANLKNAKIYTSFHTRSNIVLDGQYRVIDANSFSKKWPWYFDLVYDRIVETERQEFTDEFPFSQNAIPKGQFLSFANYKSKYLNIENNKRLTSMASQDNAKNSVYLFGDSRIYGTGNRDCDTIASYLQLFFNQKYHQNDYEVVNYGVPSTTANRFLLRLQTIALKQGDVVFFSSDTTAHNDLQNTLTAYEKAWLFADQLIKANEYCKEQGAKFIFFYLGNIANVQNPSTVEQFIIDSFNVKTPTIVNELFKIIGNISQMNGIISFDFSSIFNRPHNYGELFYDGYHLGPRGNELVAKTIFDIFIQSDLFENDEFRNKICHYNDEVRDKIIAELSARAEQFELSKYLQEIRAVSKGKPRPSGVIVVNCNPFTLGHRYLIETAAKQVNQLYVLVVEEDKSQFKFKDRFELVERGVCDLANVTVIPSGKFVISSITLPDYFVKAEKQDQEIDASMDIEIFATKIAPTLGANKRFVGEEPFCKVTKQYNDAMKKEFPKYGIELVIIPRVECDGIAISATRVRELAEKNDFEALRTLVPCTTFDYLVQHYAE